GEKGGKSGSKGDGGGKGKSSGGKDSKGDSKGNSSGDSKNDGKDSEASKDKDEGDEKGRGGDTDQERDEAKDDSGNKDGASSNSPAKTHLGTAIQKVAGFLKWVVFAIVAILVVIGVFLAVLKYLAPFTEWAKNLLDAIRNWWASLWGGGARANGRREPA